MVEDRYDLLIVQRRVKEVAIGVDLTSDILPDPFLNQKVPHRFHVVEFIPAVAETRPSLLYEPEPNLLICVWSCFDCTQIKKLKTCLSLCWLGVLTLVNS